MTDPLHLVCPHCNGVNRLPAERLAQQPKCGKCHQPLFQGHPMVLDEARFSRGTTRSTWSNFWWISKLRRSKMMAPAFEQAARQLEPEVRLAKVNTEEHQGLAMRFSIRSIPTLVLFRGGREIARTSGAMDTASLVGWTRQNL